MQTTLEQITHEALGLPRNQQVRLAHYLLALDDAGADPDVEKAWEEEIGARMKAFREGRVKTVPWEQVQAELKETLRQCK